MTYKTFDQLIDFSRTSAATYVNSTGQIATTAASINLLTYTQEFNNAAWTKVSTNITSNDIAAPDGSITADKLYPTVSAGRIYQNVTSYSQPSIFTIYLKAGEMTAFNLRLPNNAAAACAYLDLTTGTISGVDATTGAASVESTGNGWYRFIFKFSLANISNISFAPCDAVGSLTSTVSGTNGIYVWGAQLEQVPEANITLGSTITHDGISLSGGASDNGNGTYNIPALGTIRFTFPLASLVDGATYKINFASISGSPSLGSSVSDFCDVLNTQLTSGSFSYYSSRNDYNSTYRFVDIVAASGVTLTVSVATLRQVTDIGTASAYTRNYGGRYPARFDYNPVTLAAKGILVEEQRTNLLTYSEQFDNAAWTKSNATVTANSAVAPDGSTTGDVILATAGASTKFVSQTTSAVVVAAYTMSVYAKAGTHNFVQFLNNGDSAAFADFDISSGTVGTVGTKTTATIAAVGGGWFRCTATFNATATLSAIFRVYMVASASATYGASMTAAGTETVYIWGAQLEAGAFATSYIPTVASTVTRTQDTVSITGANFSEWFNSNTGTLVIQSDSNLPAASLNITNHIASFGNTSFTDYISIWRLNSGFRAVTRIGTGFSGDISVSGHTQFNAVKTALAYRTNDFAICANGGTVSTDTSTNLPTGMNEMNIGGQSSTVSLNGHIQSIKYYPTRLTNAQLQALTL